MEPVGNTTQAIEISIIEMIAIIIKNGDYFILLGY